MPVFYPDSDVPSFPLLINQSLNLCVRLAPAAGSNVTRFALVPFGRNRQRFITLPADSGFGYILLEDVVSMFLAKFFPGETIQESVAFRITRNADLELQEDQASEPLVLRCRRSLMQDVALSDCVPGWKLPIMPVTQLRRVSASRRSKFPTAGSSPHRDRLTTQPHSSRLTDSQGFDALRYEPWPPKPSPQIAPSESLFEAISQTPRRATVPPLRKLRFGRSVHRLGG